MTLKAPTGVVEIHPSDATYPDNLRRVLKDEPIYALGNIDLLSQPAIGICGSRDASESALRWAYRFGNEAGRFGLSVVSGYARGVDRQAHAGVLAAGGATIAVLSEGIDHFKLTRELRRFADLRSNFLALSTFPPTAPWAVWRAMSRNKAIVALSKGLFVIEARETGGTIDAAYECIRQGKRLWAVAYSQDGPGREGNRKLIATAAVPLRSTADLKRALEEAMADPPTEVRQLVLSLVGADSSE